MDAEDRHFGGHRIKLFLGRRAQLFQLRLVIAEADDDLCLLHDLLVGFGPFLERSLKTRDVGHLAVRRGQQIGTHRLKAAAGHVAMRIDEAGQQGGSLQIDHAGLVCLQLHHIGKGTHRQNPAILDGNGIGARGCIGHGQDRAARIDRIRRFGALRPCGSGHQNRGACHQECSTGQPHCKVLPKVIAGLCPAGEAIVSVRPSLHPVPASRHDVCQTGNI